MKKMFIKYRVLVKIVLDKDIKFILMFQETFTAE